MMIEEEAATERTIKMPIDIFKKEILRSRKKIDDVFGKQQQQEKDIFQINKNNSNCVDAQTN